MPLTEAEQTSRKEVIFDDQGQTVEVHEEPDAVAEEAHAAAAEEVSPAAAKFRIGDQEFSTEGEALAYAQRQVEIDNAYQQGVREATTNLQSHNVGVTLPPAAPEIENVEELYTNPQEFLKKYANKITSQALSEINQRDSLKAQSDGIWREFTDRHPALADFRTEVEGFVSQHNADVRSIIQTKGRPASYDFIATKLKSRFESYANALKPKRELPNGGGGPSPTPKVAGVTQSTAPKKVLSMGEQIRSIKKNR